jgi:hypothetical protein
MIGQEPSQAKHPVQCTVCMHEAAVLLLAVHISSPCIAAEQRYQHQTQNRMFSFARVMQGHLRNVQQQLGIVRVTPQWVVCWLCSLRPCFEHVLAGTIYVFVQAPDLHARMHAMARVTAAAVVHKQQGKQPALQSQPYVQLVNVLVERVRRTAISCFAVVIV